MKQNLKKGITLNFNYIAKCGLPSMTEVKLTSHDDLVDMYTQVVKAELTGDTTTNTLALPQYTKETNLILRRSKEIWKQISVMLNSNDKLKMGWREFESVAREIVRDYHLY